MAYEYELPIILGPSSTGTVLRAQLYDGTSGADVGGEISTGFTELGNGTYHWNYASMPDGHSGGVKVYENGSPTLPLTLGAVSPPETENTDVKTSTRSTLTQANILSDATPFAGGNIDTTISSRSILAQADIISDATPFAGANIDAAISSRSSYTPASDTLEGALTYDEVFRIVLSALAGLVSGGGTTTLRFRDYADSKDRIVATVTAQGNRTVITLDGS